MVRCRLRCHAPVIGASLLVSLFGRSRDLAPVATFNFPEPYLVIAATPSPLLTLQMAGKPAVELRAGQGCVKSPVDMSASKAGEGYGV